MFKYKKNIYNCLFLFFAPFLVACYPDTLRQQLAGIDTVEVIFYDGSAQLQDTLSIGSKGRIKKILNRFSKEKYSQSPCITSKKCKKYAKVLFKKQRQQRLIMEGTLYFDGSLAYISYTYAQKQWYRTLEKEQIEFFEFARHYKDLYKVVY